MKYAITILAVILSLTAVASADDAERERQLNRLDELEQARKIALRGKAAIQRGRERLHKQGDEIGTIRGGLDDLSKTVTDWKQRSDPMTWLGPVLGILGVTGIAAPIVMARRAGKQAAAALNQVASFGEAPAVDAGRPFPEPPPPPSEQGGSGRGEVRDAHAGGYGGSDAAGPLNGNGNGATNGATNGTGKSNGDLIHEALASGEWRVIEAMRGEANQ